MYAFCMLFMLTKATHSYMCVIKKKTQTEMLKVLINNVTTEIAIQITNTNMNLRQFSQIAISSFISKA